MLRKSFLFIIALIFVAGLPVFADSITLKSGSTIEGMILERTDDYVKVDVDGVSLTYYLDEIDKINGEMVRSTSSEKGHTTTFGEQRRISTSNPQREESPGASSSGFGSIENPNTNTPYPDTQTKVAANLNKEFDSRTAVTAATIGIAVILFILFLAVVGYVYSALCLHFIAKKTATTPEWLAWIPIANLFLMCKIGKVSYLWLLPLLLPFVAIPIIAIAVGFTSATGHSHTPGALPLILLPVQILITLLMAALFGFIWYRIALARNKPGWVGIAMGATIVLGLVPFVGLLGTLANLALMGYLAFSE